LVIATFVTKQSSLDSIEFLEMSDSEKNDSQQASGSNVHVIREQTRATDEDFFDATDAVRLFNHRIESALEKQRVAIVSEIHKKFQSKELRFMRLTS
jgi:uncharacterized membrane protein YcjF (UPF0283 family)